MGVNRRERRKSNIDKKRTGWHKTGSNRPVMTIKDIQKHVLGSMVQDNARDRETDITKESTRTEGEKEETSLINACIARNIELVKELIDEGTDINECDRNGNTAFAVACLMQDMGIMELLIKHGASIEELKKNNAQTLYKVREIVKLVAIDNILKKGNVCDMKTIIDNIGEDDYREELVAIVDEKAKEYVRIANKEGDSEKVAKLLDLVDVKDDMIVSLIVDADESMLDIFINKFGVTRIGGLYYKLEESKKEVILNNKTFKNIFKNLKLACESGYKKEVEKLIDQLGEIPDVVLADLIKVSPNYILRAVLMKVGFSKMSDIFYKLDEDVKDLLVRKTFLTENILKETDKEFKERLEVLIENELRVACERGNVQYMKKILDTGIDIKDEHIYISPDNPEREILSARGIVPKIDTRGCPEKYFRDSSSDLDTLQQELFRAVILGNTKRINKLLSMGTEKVPILEYEGKTLLMLAAEKNDLSLLQRLLENENVVDTADSKGKTSLMYAIEANNDRITRVLINSGADIGAVDKNQKSVLMYALEKGNKMSYIIHNMIDSSNANECDSMGVSTLMYACMGGDIDVVCRLIDCGADVNACDMHGNTPLSIVFNKKCMELTRCLIQHGAINKGRIKDANEFYKFRWAVEQEMLEREEMSDREFVVCRTQKLKKINPKAMMMLTGKSTKTQNKSTPKGQRCLNM